MTATEKQTLLGITELMFMLIHTKMEIATLVAKHQNAPKYLYEQAQSLQDRITWIIEKA